jgi:DNA replication protein DnaC
MTDERSLKLVANEPAVPDPPLLNPPPKWGEDWTVVKHLNGPCEKGHGDYTAFKMKHRHPQNLPWWTHCPRCDAALQAEMDLNDAAIQGGVTEKQRAHMARVRSANIPTRYQECTLWNWQHGADAQATVWNRVRGYASDFDRALEHGVCVTMFGSPGSGKTHLAIGILRHILDKGGTGYYTSAADLLARIKNTYHREADETEQEITRAVTSVDMLVIDEIGKHGATQHDNSYVFRLFDIRYTHNRPTVFISNSGPKELTDLLGGPMVDRLRENGGLWLPFDWASQRSRRKPKGEE